MLHHSRVLYGHDRHSWTLQTLQQTIAWMRSLTVSAVCQLLRRLKVVYKRGRAHVHSPDLEYDQKLVVWRRRGRFNVKEMYRFFYYVNKQYPNAKVISMALDNWALHFHGYVQDHLATMKTPNRIRFLPLPTYAPWTNPTEKYWLKLSREWLRFHPFAGDKTIFKRELDGWLKRHSGESPALLHEVGLLPD